MKRKVDTLEESLLFTTFFFSPAMVIFFCRSVEQPAWVASANRVTKDAVTKNGEEDDQKKW